MMSTIQERPEIRAQLILEVAKAASSHLELPDVLESLLVALKPTSHFDAIAVSVIEGDNVRLHSLHVEGLGREPGEPIESVLARAESARNLPASRPVMKRRMSDHHISVVASTLKPHVCSDLESEIRFPLDERLLENGVRSYISLPLMKRGAVLGAVDFVSFEKRNFDRGEVQLLQDVSEIVSMAVANALAYEEIKALKDQLQAENRLLQDELVETSIFEEIVGSSQALRKVLIASELFGHEKGAFTGALQQRIGRFEAANGGTIFLDEIGELTSEMQIALLRVLQEKEFERVGGSKTIRSDVRVIAATNRNLEREVSNERFQMDLYYRLNVFPVHMPPLRERADDIPILVDYFAARLASRMGKRIRQIEKRTLDAMLRYSWPGNIRELQNVIERGVILADSDVFRLEPGTLVRE